MPEKQKEGGNPPKQKRSKEAKTEARERVEGPREGQSGFPTASVLQDSENKLE